MRHLIVAVLSVGALGLLPSTSQAQGIGPVCFKANVFNNVWKMFFIPTGGNQFVGSGEDLSANRPLTGSLYVTPTTAVGGLTANVPPTGSGHPFFLTANLDLGSLSGAGRCESINNTMGCATGLPITLSVVACPAGDLVPAESLTGRPIGDH